MNKKAYTNPALRVVTMQQQQSLLAGSIQKNAITDEIEKIFVVDGEDYKPEEGEIL